MFKDLFIFFVRNRYEPELKKLVEDGMPTETEAELAGEVPLVRFLNTRARQNLALANNYNWYLHMILFFIISYN